MSANIRRLGSYLLVSFLLVSVGLAYWQVIDAPRLNAREDNPAVIALRRTAIRGNIFDARGSLLAVSERGEEYTRRFYTDSAFTHLLGYASIILGTTGVERAWDEILTGRADPNPIKGIVDDILGREAEPNDLTLTVDGRLQAFALAQLGGQVGSIVALDPRDGAILAMVSTPTFDATSLSGDPQAADAALAAVEALPNAPLVDRARDGRYTPGSVMKVFTAAAALEAGVITPETTFEEQPRQEVEGFVVDGFTIREHDLGNIRPDLWDLSPALQVSSNIYFAHVGLLLGGEAYLQAARRFGFCAPLEIGPGNRALGVAPSLVTPADEEGTACRPFADRVELAAAAFGQASLQVTPFQMALLAATIANDGVMPDTRVVRDVRDHSTGGTPSETVLERYSGGGGRRVISPDTARQVRAAMVDAVEDELGALFAGAAAVDLYGIGGVETAGKTGTAELGEGRAPHSWFIGFAPGGEDAEPAIAVAVLVENGGSAATVAAPIGGRVLAEWLRLAAAGDGSG